MLNKINVGFVGIGAGELSFSTPKLFQYENKYIKGGFKAELGVSLFEPLLRFADDFRVNREKASLPIRLMQQQEMLINEMSRIDDLISIHKQIAPVINIDFKPTYKPGG